MLNDFVAAEYICISLLCVDCIRRPFLNTSLTLQTFFIHFFCVSLVLLIVLYHFHLSNNCFEICCYAFTYFSYFQFPFLLIVFFHFSVLLIFLSYRVSCHYLFIIVTFYSYLPLRHSLYCSVFRYHVFFVINHTVYLKNTFIILFLNPSYKTLPFNI